jgi:glutathionylspermidine synthase
LGAILPILLQLYSNHPHLLKAYFNKGDLTNYVKKPLLSREGANVEIIKGNHTIEKTEGDYGEEGFVYQELINLPNFGNNYPIVGSWVIGQQAAGIGIRESNTLITNNTSRFIPHLIQ